MLATLTTVLLALAPGDAIQDPVPTGPPSKSAPFAFDRLSNGLRVRVDTIEGATTVATWLCVRAGAHHDPLGQTGLAQVLGEALRAELGAPTGDRLVEVVVLGPATLVGITLPAAGFDDALAHLAGWLDGELALDDDALLKARGRALLLADDRSAVLPGPILRERAEAILFPGRPDARPLGGRPEEIRSIEPAVIRAAFRRVLHPSRASVVVLGGVDVSTTGGLVAARLAAVGQRGVEPIEVVAPEASTLPEPNTGSSRVAAPFAARAIPAPKWGQADYLPFLIAIEVARGRAGATFRVLRGGEVKAEFPPVTYDFTRMPSAAFVQRRGKDGDPLDTTRAEIDSLLAGLRAGGAAPQEVGAAMSVLLNQLAVPPFAANQLEAMRAYPHLLHRQGSVLALHDLWGWPADLRVAIGEVTVGRVDQVLRSALAPERGCAVSLTPDW